LSIVLLCTTAISLCNIENENERLEKLTEDERRVMNKYRKLNRINKAKTEERIDIFLEQQ
jgi:hypothetical protein